MNLLLIRNLCERKEGGLKRLADEIEMSEQNLHRCINNNKIQAGDLEKISFILKVPINIFFENTNERMESHIDVGHKVNGNGNKISGNVTLSDYQKENEHLNALLHEKERIIEEKERLIQVLMSQQHQVNIGGLDKDSDFD